MNQSLAGKTSTTTPMIDMDIFKKNRMIVFKKKFFKILNYYYYYFFYEGYIKTSAIFYSIKQYVTILTE